MHRTSASALTIDAVGSWSTNAAASVHLCPNALLTWESAEGVRNASYTMRNVHHVDNLSAFEKQNQWDGVPTVAYKRVNWITHFAATLISLGGFSAFDD